MANLLDNDIFCNLLLLQNLISMYKLVKKMLCFNYLKLLSGFRFFYY